MNHKQICSRTRRRMRKKDAEKAAQQDAKKDAEKDAEWEAKKDAKKDAQQQAGKEQKKSGEKDRFTSSSLAAVLFCCCPFCVHFFSFLLLRFACSKIEFRVQGFSVKDLGFILLHLLLLSLLCSFLFLSPATARLLPIAFSDSLCPNWIISIILTTCCLWGANQNA